MTKNTLVLWDLSHKEYVYGIVPINKNEIDPNFNGIFLWDRSHEKYVCVTSQGVGERERYVYSGPVNNHRRGGLCIHRRGIFTYKFARNTKEYLEKPH